MKVIKNASLAIASAWLTLLSMAPSVLMADVTYEYTGNNYTDATKEFKKSMHVTGSITVPDKLLPNKIYDFSTNPPPFSFSDGVNTRNNKNTAVTSGGSAFYYMLYFKLLTDNNGKIKAWSLLFHKDKTFPQIAGSKYEETGTNFDPEGKLASHSANSDHDGGYIGKWIAYSGGGLTNKETAHGEVINNPGAWKIKGSKDTEKVAVVLVHGIAGSPYTFGNPGVTCVGTEEPYLIPGCEPRLEQLLEGNGLKVETFDYSDKTPVSRKWTIEKLAGELATYLCENVKKGKFKTNGSCSVSGAIDIVAHSMGGLITRSYIAGMAVDTKGNKVPYEKDTIRKLVMIATPNYGASLASLAGILGEASRASVQVEEMAFGSSFLWDLDQKWQAKNIPMKDMLVVAGTQNSDSEEGDDGVVPVASATLPANYLGNGIRYVPYSHMEDIAYILDISHLTYKYLLPFLLDKSVPEQVSYPSLESITGKGLLLVRLADSDTKKPIPPKDFESLVVYDRSPVVIDGNLVGYDETYLNTDKDAGTITVWPIERGQHTFNLLAPPKGYDPPETLTVEIDGARSTSVILWLTRKK